MEIGRLRRGELIAGASGVALFVVMFLNWFGITREEATELSADQLEELADRFAGQGDPNSDRFDVSAWEAFGIIDIVLVVAVVVAVGLAVATALARTVSLPVTVGALTASLGILATILVAYRIIDVPIDGFGRDYGVFLGLIGAAGVAVGGWLSMQEEGTTFGAQADRLQDRFGGPDEPSPPPPPPPPPSSAP